MKLNFGGMALINCILMFQQIFKDLSKDYVGPYPIMLLMTLKHQMEILKMIQFNLEISKIQCIQTQRNSEFFSWKTNSDCLNTVEQTIHPCDVNSKLRNDAEEYCGALKGEIFAQCHTMVSPEKMYQNCLHDMCTCAGPRSTCLCPILSGYSDLCASQNIMVNWRQTIPECGIHCQMGQEYKICGDSCAYSCASISMSENCTSKCVSFTPESKY